MNARRTFVLVFAIAVVWLLGKPGLTSEPLVLSLSGSSTLGSDEAPVTLVEFSDYECFYCRRHTLQIQPLVVETYVKTGKLRYVVREFPPEDTDSAGFMAAESALCARDQDRYWEMRTLLFESQPNFSSEKLLAHAQSLGLEMAPFETCLAERIHRDRALQDYLDGKAAGIRGVPAFFLGITDPDNPGRIRVVQTITGSKIYNVYSSAIDRLLLQARARGDAGSKLESDEELK